MCGEVCRRARRARQARVRRMQHVQDYRVDERERKRRSRERRRTAIPETATEGGHAPTPTVASTELAAPTEAGGGAGHAPASTANPAVVMAKLLETWDMAMDGHAPVVRQNSYSG